MKTAKLLKLAYAARVLGREVLADRERPARVFVRARRAWAARAPKAARHPFIAGFGGAFLGLIAFAAVMMLLAAVFALFGVVLRVALVVGAVWLALRMVRRFGARETRVVIVPPEARSAYYRS